MQNSHVARLLRHSLSYQRPYLSRNSSSECRPFPWGIIVDYSRKTSSYIRKYANAPAKPANATLPDICEAAPVEDAGVPDAVLDGEVEPVLCVRLPPVPALTVGDTLLSASEDAFLKAARVFAPVALRAVSGKKHRVWGKTYGGLITPTIPFWQCLPCVQ